MISTRQLAFALALAATASLTSCSSTPEMPAVTALDNRAWWTGDGVEGARKIVIDLSAQRLRYYKGGKLVGMSPISSGKEGTSTVNGQFKVLDKDIDHRSSVFGAFVDDAGNIVQSDVDARKDKAPPGSKFLGASMRYCMRIVGGFCMHEGYLPGYPASHGCVRLPTRMAEIFFNETPVGTPVEVVGHGSLASTEEEIPLGKGEVAMREPDPEADEENASGEGDAAKPKQRSAPEVIRRADLADNGIASAIRRANSTRYESARMMKQRYKKQKGSTWYLE